MRNSFHDSTITDIKFKKSQKTLTMKIKPCQSFCEAQFKGDIVLTFNPSNYDFIDIKKLSTLAEKVGIDIYGIEINLNEDSDIWVSFDITCYTCTKEAEKIKKKIAPEAWYINFLCDNLEISHD